MRLSDDHLVDSLFDELTEAVGTLDVTLFAWTVQLLSDEHVDVLPAVVE